MEQVVFLLRYCMSFVAVYALLFFSSLQQLLRFVICAEHMLKLHQQNIKLSSYTLVSLFSLSLSYSRHLLILLLFLEPTSSSSATE